MPKHDPAEATPLLVRQTKYGQAVQIPPRGLIVVSWSEIDTARQCDMKHDLAYVERWTEKEQRADGALAKGSLWHLVLEEHYKVLASTQGPKAGAKPIESDKDRLKAAVKAGTSVIFAAEKAAGKNTAALDTARLIEWIYAGYVDLYGVDPDWWIAATEHAAQVRLPNLSGRPSRFALKLKIDLVIKLRPGILGSKQQWKTFVVDHKCLAADTPIQTWNGATVMGDLHEGDLVLGSDGTWSGITTVTRSTREAYRMTLRNGQSIVSSGDHRWPVERRNAAGRYSRRELSLIDLMSGMLAGEQYRLLTAPAVPRPDAMLPVDPYVVGALLGDGGLTRVESHRYATFTKGEPAVVNRVLASLPPDSGVSLDGVSPGHVPTYRLTGEIVDRLKRIDMVGHGHSKRIPTGYLLGSEQQRRDLLAGLLDTDGSHRKGVPLYQTGSATLAADVADLVRSLGGVPTVWCNHRPKYQHGRGQPNWEVKIRLSRDWGNPFTHPDKAARFRPSYKALNERLVIGSIDPVGSVPCVDIEVDADDALFAVAGVLTHNSGKDLPRDKDFDFMDQFSLYTWALRRMGKSVFGQMYSAARTQQNLGDKDKSKPQPLDKRFSRTPMSRTDIELNRVAIEAYQTISERYRQQREVDKMGGEPPRIPNEGTCQWRCSFTEQCLHGRKGGDMRDFLRSSGFVQDFTRHS